MVSQHCEAVAQIECVTLFEETDREMSALAFCSFFHSYIFSSDIKMQFDNFLTLRSFALLRIT